MSEMANLTIIIVCAVKENKTRTWKMTQRIRMEQWLKKRSDFSDNNLLREIKMSSPIENKFYARTSPSTFGELLAWLRLLSQKMI